MKRLHTIQTTFFLVVALMAHTQISSAQTKKSTVVILATGGTIAGAGATGTQAAYKSGAVTIDAMLAAVPGINDLATIRGRTDLQRRIPGHERRHHAQARQSHQRTATLG